jgi:8-oxo-dGTP diphosphatase
MTADTSKKLKTAEVEKISHIDYFKIAISVDCVIFGFENKELRVLAYQIGS